MNKVMVAICLTLMLISIVLPVNAEKATQEEDSLHISKETLALLPLKKGDEVVRIYVSLLTYKFSSKIDELLPDYNGRIIYAVISTNGTYTSYEILDGKCVEIKETNSNYFGNLTTLLENKVIKLVDPNIKVDHTYYIYGNKTGTAIYYKTNMGNYVYYVSHAFGFDGVYLFSAEAFHEAQKASHAYTEGMLEAIKDGSVEAAESIGLVEENLESSLSIYKISSPNFDPHAPFPVAEKETSDGSKLWLICGISAGVCLVAGCSAFVFLCRRRKQK